MVLSFISARDSPVYGIYKQSWLVLLWFGMRADVFNRIWVDVIKFCLIFIILF